MKPVAYLPSGGSANQAFLEIFLGTLQKEIPLEGLHFMKQTKNIVAFYRFFDTPLTNYLYWPKHFIFDHPIPITIYGRALLEIIMSKKMNFSQNCKFHIHC